MFDTAILMSALTVILVVVGFVIAGYIGIIAAVVLSIIINVFSYWYSDRLVLRMYKAKPLKNDEVSRRVKKLCQEAKMPVPKLYIIPDPRPNAFATGRSPKHASVAVTEGLLKSLNHDEIEGVLAHELGHVKNRDILVGTIAATIAGAIAYLAQIGYWSMFFGDNRGEGQTLSLILIVIFAPLAAMLVRLGISRRREYKADMSGSLLTKKPGFLASALMKISNIARSHPIKGNSASSHLWIVNPFKNDWFNSLFSTHPPVERRIERLEEIEKDLEKPEA